MLVEESFNMVSVDASDKMLKYALKARWERRKERAFDEWGETFLCSGNLHGFLNVHLKAAHRHPHYKMTFKFLP